ncbi:MAG: hypothetical protein ACR2LE_03275 [Nocardioidaceae bacterium]
MTPPLHLLPGEAPPPGPLDLPALLTAAARRGVRVWHVERTGQLVPVKDTCPDEGARAS